MSPCCRDVCVNACHVCVSVLQCKLEQQACLTGKDLTLKCSGLCPCPTAAPTSTESKHGEIKRKTINPNSPQALYLCLSHTQAHSSHHKNMNRCNKYHILLSPLASAESCTGQDLADLGERLRDWFQLLQTNAKQNNNSKTGARTSVGSTTSGQSCYLIMNPDSINRES